MPPPLLSPPQQVCLSVLFLTVCLYVCLYMCIDSLCDGCATSMFVICVFLLAVCRVVRPGRLRGSDPSST